MTHSIRTLVLLIALSSTMSAWAGAPESGSNPPRQGEIAVTTIEGDLIKVNNKLCAVSRTRMKEETLGNFTGRVAYQGTNPKFQGKTFEFNYCCAMCQKSFPAMFEKDPDEILEFHGIM